jgi:hypothetical protein
MAISDRWRYLVTEVKPSSAWTTVVKSADLQSEMDKQGALGWELVSMLPVPYPGGYRLVFKRPG